MTGDAPPNHEGAPPARPPLAADDAVFRRIPDDPNMLATDRVTGDRRPSSGAFKPDADGVSVYSETELHTANLTYQAVFVSSTGFVARLPVSAIRAVTGLDAVSDPWPRDVPDPDHPRNAAHALITGWAGIPKGTRLDRQKALATSPELRLIL